MAVRTALDSRHVIAGVGLADRRRKSRWPARMDLAQSLTGLALGLFMWGHMAFVSSILISHDAMWMVTKAFEGYYWNDKRFAGIDCRHSYADALARAHDGLNVDWCPFTVDGVASLWEINAVRR